MVRRHDFGLAEAFREGDHAGVTMPILMARVLLVGHWPIAHHLGPRAASPAGGTIVVNSLIVMLVSTPISVALAAMAAYGLSRFKFRGREPLMFMLLAVRMLPALIIALPLFVMFRSVGLHDTLLGLIIVYTVFNLPFNIWLLHGFFINVSTEIEDSARIDGCNYWQVFMKVMVPLVAPGLVASAIFCMLLAWNEFAFALTLTYTGRSQTLPIAIAGMASDRGTLFGQMGAVGTLATLPVLAVAIYVQKYLVRGLTAGAVKG